jgi:hypothetical protein
VAGLFMVAGIVFLVASHAATNAAFAEAESGQLAGNAGSGPTNGASGGASVKFGTGTNPNPPGPSPVPGGRIVTVSQTGGAMYTNISQAANNAQPGDTILISGGTYKERVLVAQSGTAGKPITFTGKPGEKVIIDGGRGVQPIAPGSFSGGFYIKGRNYITISNLELRNWDSTAIWAEQVRDLTVDRVVASNTSHGGIVVVGGPIDPVTRKTTGSSYNVKVTNSDVSRTNMVGTGADHESLSIANTDGFEISGNKVYDSLEEGIDVKYFAKNGTVHHNETWGNAGPNIYIDAASNIKVYNNISRNLTNGTKHGISIAAEIVGAQFVDIDAKHTTNIEVFNNLIYNNAFCGIGFYAEPGGTISNVKIFNNTFYNNKHASICQWAVTSIGGTNVIRNNIFAGPVMGIDLPASVLSSFTIDRNLFSITPSGFKGTDAQVGDPRFVNAAAADFHLQAGSPAIDTALTSTVPSTDYDGKDRGGTPDMGAYER